jgi:RimJ/RimL family protein N-acetyltransferase
MTDIEWPAGAMATKMPDELAPVLEARFIRIRPIFPDDMSFLYQLSVMPETGYRWRYRGAVPSPEQFARDQTQGLLVQFLVEDRRNNHPVGTVAAFNAGLKNGTASFGVVLLPAYANRGVGMEATALLIDFLFRVWPLRKLYTHTPEWNMSQFGSVIGRVLREEGRLREHEFYYDRFWDLIILALTREEWGTIRDRVIGRRVNEN